jgi:hypothetical protein
MPKSSRALDHPLAHPLTAAAPSTASRPGIIRPMPKDRIRRYRLAPDVRVVIQRSSAHPVEYAIMLLVERDGEWHTVRTFDNAHDPTEHHEHRYVGSEKQEPIITHGSVNDAMHAAEVKIRGGWSDIVRSWENT